jgi:hypothetical protein
MTKLTTKTKGWIKDHKEGLITTGLITGTVAFYAGLIVVAVKVANAQEQEQRDLMTRLSDAASKGKSILPGPDGSYWIIDNNN